MLAAVLAESHPPPSDSVLGQCLIGQHHEHASDKNFWKGKLPKIYLQLNTVQDLLCFAFWFPIMGCEKIQKYCILWSREVMSKVETLDRIKLGEGKEGVKTRPVNCYFDVYCYFEFKWWNKARIPNFWDMVSSAAAKGDKVQFGKDHFVQTRVSSSESWKCWIIHVLDLLESYTIWSGSVDLECWPFLISPAVSVEIIFLVATSFPFGWNLMHFSFPTK